MWGSEPKELWGGGPYSARPYIYSNCHANYELFKQNESLKPVKFYLNYHFVRPLQMTFDCTLNNLVIAMMWDEPVTVHLARALKLISQKIPLSQLLTTLLESMLDPF